MKREFLTNLGITDEDLIKKILDQNTNDIGKLKGQNDQLTTNLADVSKQLDGFKDVDVDKLKGQIKDLQTSLTTKESEYQTKIADRDFNDLLKTIASPYKPKKLETVLPLLKLEDLRASKNQEADIKAAFESIKKENAYLFDSEETKPSFSGSATGPQGGTSFGRDDNNHTAVNAAFRTYMGKEGN